MMKLYKTEKVNPKGGCLPIIAQMPFFIGFFFALSEWLSCVMRLCCGYDLSVPDPFFILPIMFGSWCSHKN